MKDFTLGIIGRCLACQPWMHPQQLYHKKLKTLLQHDRINLRVSIAGRSDLSPHERMQALYTKKPLNAVLYHMRHFPTEQPLFESSRTPSGKLRYSLNPFFIKYVLKKEPTAYEDTDAISFSISMRQSKNSTCHFDVPTLDAPPRKFLGIPLRSINLWAGKICGLSSRAMQNEWSFFEKFRLLCSDLNIPIFVLGPIPTYDMIKTMPKAWRKSCLYIEQELSKYAIPSFFMRPPGDDELLQLYKRDLRHLTAEGHTYLAKELYPAIAPWIRSIAL